MHTRLGCSFFERVQIYYHHIDWLDAVFGNSGAMGKLRTAMKNSAMHLGMERLDAAVEHFGEAGEFGDVFDGNAGVAEEFRSASGRDEFDAHGGQMAGEVDESGLVGDAEQGALNLGHQGLDDELRQRKFYQDTEDAVESHANGFNHEGRDGS
jgi:hypothetical protein